MGLRGRFTLWFGFAALVTIAGAAAITREVVSSRRRAEFARDLHAAEEGARAQKQALERAVEVTVENLATRDNDLLSQILFELHKGDDGFATFTIRNQLKNGALSTMKAASLDLFMVVGQDDVVLAAPHFAARVDEKDKEPRQLAKKGGKAVWAWTETLRDGKVTRVLAVQAARTVADGGAQVVVVGGREVGEDLIVALTGRAAVTAVVLDTGGKRLFPSGDAPAAAATARSVRIPLNNGRGEPTAWLVVSVSDAELRKTLRDLTFTTAALGVLALIVALALGFLISRRITRDVDALVAGAHAVSEGNLKYKVKVRGTDELGELATAFNAMTDQLRDSKSRLVQAERVAAWQEIARSIAHEIKNPLTPIQMSVETMRKTFSAKHPSFDEIFEEGTRTVLEEVQRLKKIVGEFSQFARLPKPERQPCSIDEIVGGALALYRGSVKVVEELAGDLPPIDADRDQMTQVVLNLLENARDAVASIGSDETVGRIMVRTRRRDGIVELEVEDNGPGFDPAIQDKLFTPYFTTKEAGTGLGLAIVHRIVTDHGGTISATSTPGKGARFLVELPIRKSITDSYRAGQA